MISFICLKKQNITVALLDILDTDTDGEAISITSPSFMYARALTSGWYELVVHLSFCKIM